jgi:hypothetical protein
MYHPRTQGLTLRRRIRHALYQPYGDEGKERFDWEFPVATKCEFCGKIGYGPRRTMQEAIREHQEQCPAKRTRANATEFRTDILYPRI